MNSNVLQNYCLQTGEKRLDCQIFCVIELFLHLSKSFSVDQRKLKGFFYVKFVIKDDIYKKSLVKCFRQDPSEI